MLGCIHDYFRDCIPGVVRPLLKIIGKHPVVTKFAMSYSGSKCLPDPGDPVARIVARRDEGFASAVAALSANNLFSQ